MINNKWREVYDCPESVDPWKNGIPDNPLYLDIEPSNFCNFKCSFCVAHAGTQMTRQKGFMDIKLFKNICEQAEEMGVKGVRFLRWGEPFMNKEMPEFLKIAKEHKLLTHVTTNGTLLDEKIMLEILPNLDSIIFSMQGTNEEEYQSLRGANKSEHRQKDDYQKLCKNIKLIRKLRDNIQSETFLIVSTTLTDELKEQVDSFKEKWLEYVDDISVGFTWFGRLENKNPVEEHIKRSKKLPKYFKCQEVMVKLSIDWDGKVSPCCLDYNNQLTIGDATKTPLKEIWKCEQVKAIRILLSNKRQDLFDLCKTCELNYDFRGTEDG